MKRCGFHHLIALMKVSHWSNFGALTPPIDFTPSKRTPFSAISLIVCACMHQTGPSHGLKRLEGMKRCCFYHSIELMKVSHWSNFGALTPPFDSTRSKRAPFSAIFSHFYLGLAAKSHSLFILFTCLSML